MDYSEHKNYFDLAIAEAQKSFDLGCYPVGAVLVIDNGVVYSGGNSTVLSNSLVSHAENNLIIEHGSEIFEASKKRCKIKLYSTLEPCLMCLGSAVKNKITDIYYIQQDPHGGACNIDIETIGVRYKEIWPTIKQISYSDVPQQLLIKYLENDGSEWSKNLLSLIR